jgi:tyrosyl-tRNA synthetase
VDLLVRAKLAPSKGEARRLIEGGGVQMAGILVENVQQKASAEQAAEGRLLIRVGKKRMFRFDVA